MLPSKNRITKRAEFDRVKNEGRLFSSESFSIGILNRRDKEPSRFGFVVSTKISKKATIRNKTKRALKEGIRQNFSLIAGGYDCVFLAKPIIIKKYTDELMHEVRVALQKAELIK